MEIPSSAETGENSASWEPNDIIEEGGSGYVEDTGDAGAVTLGPREIEDAVDSPSSTIAFGLVVVLLVLGC